MDRIKVSKTSVALCMNIIDDMPDKDDELLELSKTLFLETIKSIQAEKMDKKHSSYFLLEKNTRDLIKKINTNLKLA